MVKRPREARRSCRAQASSRSTGSCEQGRIAEVLRQAIAALGDNSAGQRPSDPELLELTRETYGSALLQFCVGRRARSRAEVAQGQSRRQSVVAAVEEEEGASEGYAAGERPSGPPPRGVHEEDTPEA